MFCTATGEGADIGCTPETIASMGGTEDILNYSSMQV
jgi:hypothetical protein